MQENSSIFVGIDRATSTTSLNEFLLLEYLCELAEEEKSSGLLHSRKVDLNSADLDIKKIGKSAVRIVVIKWSAALIGVRQTPPVEEEEDKEKFDPSAQRRRL
ncbi:unnamed protein product [Hymenolepis diminuta]|uniref:Uncharacterized protein n=1 Tax=Hymenolepis diminuta TaxID=6216 RepID=A0A564YI06_HYMDI|nr:unnamed protein product [Hymenolepis diminuta]